MKICFLFFYINCNLIYKNIYNFIILFINYCFKYQFDDYNIYLKFPFTYPLFDKKYLVPNNVAIIYVGNPPVNFITRLYKFRKTIMIVEVDQDKLMNDDTIFQHNFNLDQIMKGFITWIGISNNKTFRIYSINGCSQIYDWSDLENVKMDIFCKFFLKPVPPKHQDFRTKVEKNGHFNQEVANYFKTTSRILTQLNLLPIKRDISYLGCNFRTYMAQKFLCGRNGMSYGFLAYQNDIKISKISEVISPNFVKKYGFRDSQFYFQCGDKYFIFDIPIIQLIATRSGCDKSSINHDKDLIMYQINNFKIDQILLHKNMIFQPSFDIWIILVQAFCNIIIINILRHYNPNHPYIKKVQENGIMIVHIHAFPDKNKLPKGCLYFGEKNPSISCGCPESSYYCFYDQFNKFIKNIDYYSENYSGSLFLEKDHGIVFSSDYPKNIEKLDDIFNIYHYGVHNFKTFI